MSSTIHVDDLTGDVGWASQQKDQRLLDLLFVTPAPERDVLDDFRACSPVYRREHGPSASPLTEMRGASATARDWVNAASAALLIV